MIVQEVTTTATSEKVTLMAVSSGINAEDNNYAKYTPSAKLEITIDNPEAQGVLKPGKAFYIDFTRVKEEAPTQA